MSINKDWQFFYLLIKLNKKCIDYKFLYKEVLTILSSTHKIVAKIVCNRIKEDYDINLNMEKIQWGSICPDILPYYRLIRHYQDESIDYISKEIANLIYFCRYSNLRDNPKKVLVNYLSKKLGVISHYLCDYVCYPHAYRMTYFNDMKAHIKYESDLNEYVLKDKALEENYKGVISCEDLDLFKDVDNKLKDRIKAYIEDVVNEYKSNEPSFDNDMDFALDISSKIASFVIESVMEYNEDFEIQFV